MKRQRKSHRFRRRSGCCTHEKSLRRSDEVSRFGDALFAQVYYPIVGAGGHCSFVGDLPHGRERSQPVPYGRSVPGLGLQHVVAALPL